MRKYSPFLLLLLSYQSAFSQKVFDAEAFKLVHHIVRNLSPDDKERTGCDFEYFVYDITIDTSGAVTAVHLLLVDSLYNLAQAKALAGDIKAKFKFSKSNYRKLLVPVFIVHSDADDAFTTDENAVLETIGIFKKLFRKNNGSTYITQSADIISF